MPPGSLVEALAGLWRLQSRPPNLFSSAPFVRAREACQQLYEGTGSKDALSFALSNALHRLGVPYELPGSPFGAMTPEAAAQQIDLAFRTNKTKRVHLCPLDLADELPELNFGPNIVRTFTAAELTDLVDPFAVERRRSTWSFDAGRFAEFTWLVVTEEATVAGEPGARAVPALFLNLGEDFGRIQPHKRRVPDAVEKALFSLLLAPWEDWTAYRDLSWRCFTVPWVHTVEHDLFERASEPPLSGSLSWEPYIFHDYDHEEEIETERPVRYPLTAKVAEATSWINDQRWLRAETAATSELLETPVVHFLVRGFLADEIDEYLAHMTMLEAALGTRERDATRKMKARITRLLDDPSAGDLYGRLFDLRSEFVHGRKMGDISGDDRTLARVLARRVADALLHVAANTPGTDRKVWLRDLLA